MSYGGGLTIKIKNKKLGEVLDEFADKGNFPTGIGGSNFSTIMEELV